MRLVEVIRAADTSEGTWIRCALARRLGKTAVRVKDVPGFLVNLLGRAYITEALHIQHEASPGRDHRQDMRAAAGFRMGPFELMDLTGIDVNFPATRVVYEGFQHDPRLKTTVLHDLSSWQASSAARLAVDLYLWRKEHRGRSRRC